MVSFFNSSPLTSWREGWVGKRGEKSRFQAHEGGKAWGQVDSGSRRFVNDVGEILRGDQPTYEARRRKGLIPKDSLN